MSDPPPQGGVRFYLSPDNFRHLDAKAFEAGKAPKVRLTGTHEATLEVVPVEVLKRYAIELS